MSASSILKTIRQHPAELKSFGVKQLGLFGSFAQSRQTSKSDLDFLVEFKRGKKNFDNYMDLKFFLEKTFRRKVDLVVKNNLKNRIKNRILSEVQYA